MIEMTAVAALSPYASCKLGEAMFDNAEGGSNSSKAVGVSWFILERKPSYQKAAGGERRHPSEVGSISSRREGVAGCETPGAL